MKGETGDAGDCGDFAKIRFGGVAPGDDRLIFPLSGFVGVFGVSLTVFVASVTTFGVLFLKHINNCMTYIYDTMA